jgi:hypothetical protein
MRPGLPVKSSPVADVDETRESRPRRRGCWRIAQASVSGRPTRAVIPQTRASPRCYIGANDLLAWSLEGCRVTLRMLLTEIKNDESVAFSPAFMVVFKTASIRFCGVVVMAGDYTTASPSA